MSRSKQSRAASLLKTDCLPPGQYGSIFLTGLSLRTALLISLFRTNPATRSVCRCNQSNAAGVDEAFGFKSDISGRLDLEGELTARGGSPDALRKSAQGSFEIHFWNGVINKFGFVSKVFSILNVSQLFALRLPDMVSTGMPYDSINGSFSVKDGIFSTSDLGT